MVTTVPTAEEIKAWRQRIGTRTFVAKLLGVSVSTLQYWENGEHRPRGKTLGKLVRQMQVNQMRVNQ